MGIIKVNYKGKEYQAEQGKRAIEILKEAETETSAFLVASINGKFIDLGTQLNEGGELKAFTFEDAEGKQAFWHSTSHIMAAAVKRR